MQLMITLFLSLGHTDWFCTESISQKRGDTFLVCGVGRDSEESSAREKSTEAAFREFDILCKRDQSCTKFETIVNPKRSECIKSNQEFECRRMFEIRVSQNERSFPLTNNFSNVTQAGATIFIGKSKQALLSEFGIPNQIIDAAHDGSSSTQIFSFKSPLFCQSLFCSVIISNDQVEKYSDFKPEFTDSLSSKKKSMFQNLLDIFM